VVKLSALLLYLEHEWGITTARKFQANVDKYLALIAEHPFIGIKSGIENVRSVLVTKHNRIFYKISGGKIIILNITIPA